MVLVETDELHVEPCETQTGEDHQERAEEDPGLPDLVQRELERKKCRCGTERDDVREGVDLDAELRANSS